MTSLRTITCVAVAFGFVIGLAMLFAGLEHNPQGEFYDHESGNIRFWHAFSIFASWFVVTALPIFALFGAGAALVSYIRQGFDRQAIFNKPTGYTVIPGKRGYVEPFGVRVVLTKPANTREGFLVLTAHPQQDAPMCSDSEPPNPPEPPYKIIPSPRKSELERFASFFHQDYDLMFSNFYIGADMYIRNIPEERKAGLKSQLQRFVDTHESSSALKKAWFKLGAGAWDEDLVIREVLLDFVEMLQNDNLSTKSKE